MATQRRGTTSNPGSTPGWASDLQTRRSTAGAPICISERSCGCAKGASKKIYSHILNCGARAHADCHLGNVAPRAHAARKRGFAHPTDDERNPLYPSKYRIAPAALATTNVAEIQITAMMIHTDQ